MWGGGVGAEKDVRLGMEVDVGSASFLPIKDNVCNIPRRYDIVCPI